LGHRLLLNKFEWGRRRRRRRQCWFVDLASHHYSSELCMGENQQLGQQVLDRDGEKMLL
jgi:hypothetical protein